MYTHVYTCTFISWFFECVCELFLCGEIVYGRLRLLSVTLSLSLSLIISYKQNWLHPGCSLPAPISTFSHPSAFYPLKCASALFLSPNPGCQGYRVPWCGLKRQCSVGCGLVTEGLSTDAAAPWVCQVSVYGGEEEGERWSKGLLWAGGEKCLCLCWGGILCGFMRELEEEQTESAEKKYFTIW